MRRPGAIALPLALALTGSLGVFTGTARAAGTNTAAAASSVWSDLWWTRDQQGERLLQTDEPAQAARRFRDPRRRAYADLAAGRNAEAARLLAPYKDPRSLYNRGNALARSGQLQAALSAYNAVLAMQPSDRDARHNRDLVARALRQHPPKSPHAAGSGGKAPDSSSAQKSGSAPGAHSNGSASKQGATTKQGPTSGRSAAGTPGASPGTTAGARSGTRAGSGPGSSPRPGHSAGNTGGAVPGTPAQHGTPSSDSRLLQLARAGQGQHGTGQSGAANAGMSGANATRSGPSTLIGSGGAAQPPPAASEQTLSLEQWLRRIPDDPAGLLRRKFLIQHLMRQQGQATP